ncbi:copper resistance CopC family protein [Actinokineospora sp. NPDC004072]
MSRITLVIAAAAALLLAGAPAATAHVELASSDPADGATLGSAPTTVTLAFTGPVLANPESVKITAPDGTAWAVSDVETAGGKVTAAVEAAGPPGVHGMSYRVTSDDGHVLTGTIRFTLSGPTTTPPTTTPPTTTAVPTTTIAVEPVAEARDGGGFPAWAWALIAAGVLIVGFAVARRRR